MGRRWGQTGAMLAFTLQLAMSRPTSLEHPITSGALGAEAKYGRARPLGACSSARRALVHFIESAVVSIHPSANVLARPHLASLHKLKLLFEARLLLFAPSDEAISR